MLDTRILPSIIVWLYVINEPHDQMKQDFRVHYLINLASLEINYRWT